MRYIYTEKLILTKEEFEILDKARALLDAIYVNARKDSEIEALAYIAMGNVCDLLSDERSDLEEI